MKLNQKQVQHLYWRAGFGTDYNTVIKNSGKSDKELVNKLLSPYPYTKLTEDMVTRDRSIISKMSEEEMNAWKRKNRQNVTRFNTRWVSLMATSEDMVREKMAFFWHNHFACSSNFDIHIQSYLDLIRKNALGTFRDLLFAMAREPMMLYYLNNEQNRKTSPNENFAREVMELFTLGRNKGYTEKDIREAARAFTGWGSEHGGIFKFREKLHDYGEKTIFGKTGNFSGEDVLNMLLHQKHCARHLSEKLYCFMVNPKVNENHVAKMADVLYESDYDIKTWLSYVFTSKWFYDEENIGVKIKSPVELLVGIQRGFHLALANPDDIVFIENILGQRIFYPPNVAGWAGDKSWIDSSTLLFRTSLVESMFKSSKINFEAKDTGDENNETNMMRKAKRLEVRVKTQDLINDFNQIKSNGGLPELSNFLVQVPVAAQNYSMAEHSYEDILNLSIDITKAPEYQLC